MANKNPIKFLLTVSLSETWNSLGSMAFGSISGVSSKNSTVAFGKTGAGRLPHIRSVGPEPLGI